jgi:hypothetical protein
MPSESDEMKRQRGGPIGCIKLLLNTELLLPGTEIGIFNNSYRRSISKLPSET